MICVEADSIKWLYNRQREVESQVSLYPVVAYPDQHSMTYYRYGCFKCSIWKEWTRTDAFTHAKVVHGKTIFPRYYERPLVGR